MVIHSPVVSKLAQVSLFQDLGPAGLEELALMCTRKKFPANSPVPLEDENGFFFFVVSHGKFVMKSKNKFLSYLGLGDFFGEISVVDSEPNSVDIFTGDTEAEVLAFTQKDFLEILQNYSSIHLALSRELCRRLRLIDHKLSFIPLSSRTRIVRHILQILEKQGQHSHNGIVLPKLSLGDVSKNTDTNKETVTQIFEELRNEGLISATESKQVLIPDKNKLEEWLKSNINGSSA